MGKHIIHTLTILGIMGCSFLYGINATSIIAMGEHQCISHTIICSILFTVLGFVIGYRG